MVKKLLIAICLMACASSALAVGKLQGYVALGGQSVHVVGFQSTTKVMKTYPGATVTVYRGGTLTLATIYSDAVLTPKANPFTASSTAEWSFFAQDGEYDVTFSGVAAGITVPWTAAGLEIGTEVVLSLGQCGAAGDGVTDDTAAIQACIDAAYAAGGVKATLWVPTGTFRHDYVEVKCSIDGVGTFKSRNTLGTQASIGLNLTVPNAYEGVTISNITIDGNLAGATPATYTGTSGLRIQASNTTASNLKIQNTLHVGIDVTYTDAAYLSGVRIVGNQITTTRSNDSLIAPVYGDGVHSQGTSGLLVEGNVITDGRRVGITIEGYAGLKSINAKIVNNRVSSYSLAATPEENACVWFENALSGTAINNTCTSTGRGFIVAPLAGTADSRFDLIANGIINNDRAAFVFTGISEKTTIRVAGGYVTGTVLDATKASQQVNISNNGGHVIFDGVYFGSVTSINNPPCPGTCGALASYPNNSQAGLFFVNNTGATYPLVSLTLTNLIKDTQSLPHSDSAEININSTGGLGAGQRVQNIFLTNNHGSWSMITKEAVDLVRAQNTILTKVSGGAIISAVTAGYELSEATRIYSLAGGGSTNVAATDHTVLASHSGGAGTLGFSIPTGQPRGRTIIFKDYSGTAAANNIVITDAGGLLIDGGASLTISSNNGSAKIQLVDGSAWRTVP